MKETKEIQQRATQKLQQLLESATAMRARDEVDGVNPEVVRHIEPFLQRIENDKSLVQVIVTSAIKKLISPEQDIRLHMTKFDGGYSARSLDTKVTTPFFNKYFPTYANKETAFLTKATRADLKWNLEEGKGLPLRSRFLIEPFLDLINKIQIQSIDVELCIIYILAKLQELSEQHQIYYDDALKESDVLGVINIATILEMLEEHFCSHLGSRLPVIAIYAIYEQMIRTIKRYEGKTLCSLNIHTSADRHGYGDVEVINADGSPYEIVEIKHNVPIDQNLIIDVAKKSDGTQIKKYYILTTYPSSFKSAEEEKKLNFWF